MRMKEIVASGLVSLTLAGCSTNEFIGAKDYSCERQKHDGGTIIYIVRQGKKSAELKAYYKGSIEILYNEKLWMSREEILKALDSCVENFKKYDRTDEN